MPTYIDAALVPLVEKLRARYAGVRVVDARLTRWPDGFLQQTIRYQASLAELTRCGLVTEEMLRQRGPRSACGKTSLGEAFHLGKCGTALVAGCWDLDVCTESAPREPDRLELAEALGVLGPFRRSRVSR